MPDTQIITNTHPESIMEGTVNVFSVNPHIQGNEAGPILITILEIGEPSYIPHKQPLQDYKTNNI